MSNNKKRAIKARKQKFGESHSTARMHVVGKPTSPPIGAPPGGRIRRLVEEVIAVAERVEAERVARSGLGPDGMRVVRAGDLAAEVEDGLRHDALRERLATLDEEDLRKVEVLMCAGREGGAVLAMAEGLVRDLPRQTVDYVASKSLALARYLRRGLQAADAERVDLDAEWPIPPLRPGISFKVRAFEHVFDRGLGEPAAVISGVLAGDAFEFRLNGARVGRLRGTERGRDRIGPWVAVQIGEGVLDSGVPVIVKHSFDEFRGEVDGIEIDVLLAGRDDRSGSMSAGFDMDGVWNGGGPPARVVRLAGGRRCVQCGAAIPRATVPAGERPRAVYRLAPEGGLLCEDCAKGT